MRRLRTIAFASVLATAFVARAEAPLPPALQILGNVTNAARPVANALVIALNLKGLDSIQTYSALDGTFMLPLDPASPTGYTEGNAAQYTWMVTYDFAGLIDLMGGPATASQRLDHHFTQVNGGLTTPFFYIGNEPEHGTPWTYNFAGAPWKTQSTVRKFKDSTGNYLWQPPAAPGGKATLMTFPVVEAEDMPDIATNSLSIAFGDFYRGYLVVDRAGVSVLRDPYTAKPYVLFYTTKRVGGGVQDFDAIKLVKFAVS